MNVLLRGKFGFPSGGGWGVEGRWEEGVGRGGSKNLHNRFNEKCRWTSPQTRDMNALIKENYDFLRALTQCIIPNRCHRRSPETQEMNTLLEEMTIFWGNSQTTGSLLVQYRSPETRKINTLWNESDGFRRSRNSNNSFQIKGSVV